jgi:hypothetical protein
MNIGFSGVFIAKSGYPGPEGWYFPERSICLIPFFPHALTLH